MANVNRRLDTMDQQMDTMKETTKVISMEDDEDTIEETMKIQLR